MRAAVGRLSRDDAVLGAVLATLIVIGLVDSTQQLPALSPGRSTVTLTCQLLVFAIGVLHVLPVLRPVRDRVWPFTLALQGLATLLPVAVFGVFWGSEPGFFLGSCLILLPAWAGWTVVAAVEVVTVVVHPSVEGDLPYLLTANVTSALTLWSVAGAVATLHAVHASRAEVARLAVARERSRFLRDLHDLLGYSLSAMSLKGELALRLAPTDPERARAELRDVGELAREAARDVRAVAAGDRELALAEQLESAAFLLEAAGVDVTVAVDPDLVLSATGNAVLATVVREAVTNLLRHSRATRCDIRATHVDDRVVIEIVNDGVTGVAPGTHHGLANLQSRLTAVGGGLRTRVDEAGRFAVTGHVPAPARSPAGADR